MISSPSVPGPELNPPAVPGTLAPTPLARLVAQARVAGYALVGVGAVGILAGLASASGLSLALAAGSAVAGGWLLWTIHQFGMAQESFEGSTERNPDGTGDRAGLLLLQAVACMGELAASAGRAVLKVLACVVAGTGTGLVTVGIFALRQPELWEYEAVRRAGPPIASVLLGAGVGLLTAEVLLIALFWRSWSRPAAPVGAARPREE
jgi:hypothetical protein